MASPPFSLNTAAPANTDIAANFPSLDRTDKDVIQSWLLTQMNTYGHDNYTLIDQVGSVHGPGSAPTPAAGTIAVYYDEDTQLKQYSGDVGSVEIVGVPAGTMFDFAGSTTPAGYILLTGTQASPQTVLRASYPRLFAVLGTSWGNGDGATTFGLPPADSFVAGSANATLGSSGSKGGTASIILTQDNLPNVSFTVSISSGQGTHTHSTGVGSNLFVTSGAGSSYTLSGGSGQGTGISATAAATLPALTGTAASGGSATPISLPPYIVVNKIIKY